VDSGASLDDLERRKFLTLRGLEIRLLCRPARCQSLYRVSYPSTCFTFKRKKMSTRDEYNSHKTVLLRISEKYREADRISSLNLSSHIYITAGFFLYTDQTLDNRTWMGGQTFINTSNVNQYLGQVSASGI
jgi:hypothetical protein